MSDEMDVAGEVAQGDTRRDALKKLGVGAAVAWSVPVIASSPAWAGASDAPFPPGYCPLCNPPTDVVVNGNANLTPIANGWSVTDGTFTNPTYGSLGLATVPPGGASRVFLLDPNGTLPSDPRGVATQTLANLGLAGPATSGGCAEQQARFSFYAACEPDPVDDPNNPANLQWSLEFSVGAGAYSTAASGTITGRSRLDISANGLAFVCRTVTLPTADVSDQINARIRFSMSPGDGHNGFIDLVQLVVCATC